MNPHKLQMLHASGECDWRTSPEMVAALLKWWPQLDIDLAAKVENAIIEREGSVYFLGPDHPTESMRDSLAVPWHEIATWGFINPPYSLSQYSAALKMGIDRADLQWLLIESWAKKAYQESLRGFHTIGVFPYAAQTEWFREWVMGFDLTTAKANKDTRIGWKGHAALNYWRIPHRVDFLRANGERAANANVNTCIVHWGPNPGFQGPWDPSGPYWSYR